MIRFKRVEPSWSQPRRCHGDSRPDSRYEVVVNNLLIGHVQVGSEESWQKHGRIRTHLIGRPTFWTANDLKGERVGYHFMSRQHAAEALLRHVRETGYVQQAAILAYEEGVNP